MRHDAAGDGRVVLRHGWRFGLKAGWRRSRRWVKSEKKERGEAQKRRRHLAASPRRGWWIVCLFIFNYSNLIDSYFWFFFLSFFFIECLFVLVSLKMLLFPLFAGESLEIEKEREIPTKSNRGKNSPKRQENILNFLFSFSKFFVTFFFFCRQIARVKEIWGSERRMRMQREKWMVEREWEWKKD